MSGRHIERGRGRGESFVLALAFALLFPLLASAVAPPVAPEEVPGPGPLLNPDDIHTNPVHMATAAIGNRFLPHVGGWAMAGNLVAGVQAGSWDLKSILTYEETRRPFGAALLVAAGFNPGVSHLNQINLLQIGHSLEFWALQDTDKLLHLTPEELRVFQDGTPIGDGGAESRTYNHFLIRAFFTSPKAFASRVRTDLTYAHLLREPDTSRGEVVRVEGRLLRINRFLKVPYEVQKEGVSSLYEAYIYDESFGASPYCVVFTNWPDNLPLSYLGQAKIKEIVRVRTAGYFVKTYKYKASDGRNTERELPLVVTHTLAYEKPPEVVTDRRDRVYLWMYLFMGGLGALVVGVLGVTFWYRRNDLSTRRRLMAHAPEFVLPPPDAPPSSPPMAMPVRPNSGIDRSVPMKPRITFPSSGKGDGERGDKPKEGQPPDEGAGA